MPGRVTALFYATQLILVDRLTRKVKVSSQKALYNKKFNMRKKDLETH